MIGNHASSKGYRSFTSLGVLLLVVMITLVGCGGTPTPAPATPTLQPTVRATATAQPTAPATATPQPTVAPTAAPQPTAPATATPSPLPSPTTVPAPSPTVASSGQQSGSAARPGTVTPASTAAASPATVLPAGVLFNDDFSSRQASESLGWKFTTDPSVDYLWSAGNLTASIKKAQWMGFLWPNGSYDNFGAEVEAQPASDSFAEYGLLFRVQGTDNAGRTYYGFGVTSDGKYFVWKRVAGNWISPNPVDNTASPYIKLGKARNILGVVVQGSAISLYINRFPVTTITDTTISGQGLVGVFASTSTNDATAVAFSRLTVLTMAKASADWGAATAAAPLPTATPAAAAVPAAAPGVLFSDDFASPQASQSKGWSLSSGDNATYTLSANKFTMSIKTKNWIGWSTPSLPFDDFAAEAEAQPGADGFAAYGIVFRLGGSSNAQSFDLFGVTTDGKYYIQEQVGGKWSDPDPLLNVASAVVKPGKAANTIGVIAQGGTLWLYVNHTLVKSLTDNAITGKGFVGIYTATGDADSALVSFSKFTILSADKAKADWGTALAPTPAVAPTPASGTTPVSASGVLFSDDFSSLQSSVSKGWDLEAGDNSDYAIAGGNLTIDISAQNLIAWTMPGGTYDNFAAETVAQPAGNTYAEYGLVFRLSGPDNSRSYYLFGVSSDGQYFLWAKWAGEWVDPDPVPYTDAASVNQGRTANTIGVIVQSNVISMYINHVLVKTITDGSVAGAGSLGVFAATGDSATTAVAFDQFTILTPDKAKTDWGVK